VALAMLDHCGLARPAGPSAASTQPAMSRPLGVATSPTAPAGRLDHSRADQPLQLRSGQLDPGRAG
jgi:hypothetical protein